MRRLLVITCLIVAPVLAAAQADEVTLWITLGDSDQLVEVDAYSFREIRRITVDPKPHGLSASADGTRLYVASDRTGNFQVVDARTGTITAQVNLGKDPNQMTITDDGLFAYVPMRDEDAIAVVQLDPLRIIRKIPSPAGPHDSYAAPDSRLIYVGAQRGNAIAVVDPESRSIVRSIATADGVRPMEPSNDGKRLYASLSNLVGFIVVDPATRQVLRRVELGGLPDGVPAPYLDTWTHSLELVKNDSELWVTDCINDLVRIVDTKDYKEIGQIRVGHFPHWFSARGDGKVLFLSLWYSDAVAAIDIDTRKVLTNIQFARGSGPKRILVTPRVRAAS